MADEELLDRPVSELNLSVRPRLCLQRLGINTLGELVQRTGAELLEAPNFGVPSLAEIREKLAQYGLSLRRDEQKGARDGDQSTREAGPSAPLRMP